MHPLAHAHHRLSPRSFALLLPTRRQNRGRMAPTMSELQARVQLSPSLARSALPCLPGSAPGSIAGGRMQFQRTRCTPRPASLRSTQCTRDAASERCRSGLGTGTCTRPHSAQLLQQRLPAPGSVQLGRMHTPAHCACAAPTQCAAHTGTLTRRWRPPCISLQPLCCAVLRAHTLAPAPNFR